MEKGEVGTVTQSAEEAAAAAAALKRVGELEEQSAMLKSLLQETDARRQQAEGKLKLSESHKEQQLADFSETAQEEIALAVKEVQASMTATWEAKVEAAKEGVMEESVAAIDEVRASCV